MIVYFAKRPHFITGALACDSFFSSLSGDYYIAVEAAIYILLSLSMYFGGLQPDVVERDNAIPFFSRTHK